MTIFLCIYLKKKVSLQLWNRIETGYATLWDCAVRPFWESLLVYFPYLRLVKVGLSAKVSSCFGGHCGHKVSERILNSEFAFICSDQEVLLNRLQLGPWWLSTSAVSALQQVSADDVLNKKRPNVYDVRRFPGRMPESWLTVGPWRNRSSFYGLISFPESAVIAIQGRKVSSKENKCLSSTMTTITSSLQSWQSLQSLDLRFFGGNRRDFDFLGNPYSSIY